MTQRKPSGVPHFPVEAAAKIARDAYGIEGVLASLPSEWDQNFHVRNGHGREFLLKIANENADAAFLKAQNTVLKTIEERDPFITARAWSVPWRKTTWPKCKEAVARPTRYEC